LSEVEAKNVAIALAMSRLFNLPANRRKAGEKIGQLCR